MNPTAVMRAVEGCTGAPCTCPTPQLRELPLLDTIDKLRAQLAESNNSLDALRKFLGDMRMLYPVGRVIGLVKDLRAELVYANDRIRWMREVDDDLAHAIEEFAEASYAFADDPGVNQGDPKAVAERRRQDELQALIVRKIGEAKAETDQQRARAEAAEMRVRELEQQIEDYHDVSRAAPPEPADRSDADGDSRGEEGGA